MTTVPDALAVPMVDVVPSDPVNAVALPVALGALTVLELVTPETVAVASIIDVA